jgi:Tfp pilus assembly protein PilZ
MPSPTSLTIRFATRRSALGSYRIDGPTISLFVPTEAAVEVGGPAELDISFGDCAQTFLLRGRITWRRAEARGMKLAPGLGIAFVGGEKFEVARMLAFCAGKSLDLGTSGDPRVPTTIECQLSIGTRQLRTKVRDLSSSGAFISLPEGTKLAPGREISVTLEPGWFGLGGKTLEARVVWTGRKGGGHGFGARFVGPPGELRPLLRKYVSRA